MQLYILDKDTREKVETIDNYDSLIWNERYYECGDFEIYAVANEKNINALKKDNYVMRYESNMVGIIETIKITTDIEKGDYIIASGRDLTSLLGRRVCDKLTMLSGTVEDCLRTMIHGTFIEPRWNNGIFYDRIMPNFILGEKQNFTETMDAQFTGDNVLDVVTNYCRLNKYGFGVILNADKNFEFQLYRGTDRSNYVEFSPNYQNLINSTYGEDVTEYKNAAFIAGEGEGVNRFITNVSSDSSASGLYRREIFVDARDLSKTTDDGTLTDSQYQQVLKARGLENLTENKVVNQFESEVESSRQFVFGRDYFLGDMVKVKNNHGVEIKSRVIGIIESHDNSGHKIIPTFEESEV